MYFPESFAQAVAHGDSAMARMREIELPPTPNNYTIWYVYHSGIAPELKRDIDQLIEKKTPITREIANELYDRYFGIVSESETIRETGQSLERAIERLMGFVQEAGDGSAEYGEALENFSGQLQKDNTAAEMRTLVGAILAETKKMSDRNDNLQSELIASTKEVSELRETINNARREALTDALTGLANRKAFDEAISAMSIEAERDNTTLALLMLDIDHFKRFNDTYGHQLGDQVLRLVARTFTECIKGRDMAARYGGEEFAILLPQTQIQNAVKLGDAIRETVAKKRIVNRQSGQSLGQITLSVGVAIYRPGEPSADLIQRADEALYSAKRGGRNRVVHEGLPGATAAA
jgi:diguanylate cyclase